MCVTALCCCISVWLNGSIIMAGVMPWLMELVADLWPQRLEFDVRSFYVESVVEDAAVGQVFPPGTSILHSCSVKSSFICHRRYINLTFAGVDK
jgi:hypothetical protein